MEALALALCNLLLCCIAYKLLTRKCKSRQAFLLAIGLFFCIEYITHPSIQVDQDVVLLQRNPLGVKSKAFNISNDEEINIFLQSQTNKIILDVPNSVSNQIYFNYYNMFCNGCDFAPIWLIVTALCAENLHFSMFVVGANYGGSTKNVLNACLQVNRNMHPTIYAFEAIPEIYAKFIYRIHQFNNSENVYTFNNALSNEYNKSVEVHSNLGGGGGIHNNYRTDVMISRGYVQTTTFDHVLHYKHNNNIVDYVIIDVEGFEVNVIKGMKLETNYMKFPMIQIELGGTWVDARHATNWTQRDISQYLESLGYILFLLGGDRSYDFWIDKNYGFDIRGIAKLLRIYSNLFDVNIMRGDNGRCPKGQEYVQGNLLSVHIEYIRKDIKNVMYNKLKELQLETFNHMKYVNYSQPGVNNNMKPFHVFY
eukprot:63536_1